MGRKTMPLLALSAASPDLTQAAQMEGPVDASTSQPMQIVASAQRPCWDCSYQDKPARQYRPGEAVIHFEPVLVGSISYHF